MIKFISNGQTDQFGRSNFVDERGVCVGLKEYPDGKPIMWVAFGYGDMTQPDSIGLKWEDITPDMQPDLRTIPFDRFRKTELRVALDGVKYHFGEVGIEPGYAWNDGILFAKIQLIPDDTVDGGDSGQFPCGRVLYIVLANASDLYTTDFTLSVDEKRKLFGGGVEVDSVRGLVAKIRTDVNMVLSDLSKLEGMLEDAAKKG